ncbi:hypothetical protein F5X96DRAFT_669078 [Biscogniauxia mediterranea]|nr:hypothetical protein F5X96DRAFT_669078 [Biscogniauxia mediterranea]
MGIAGPNKRKLPFGGLQRRVRARKEEEPEPDSDEVLSDESRDEESDSEQDSSLEASDDEEESDESASNSSDEDEDEDSEGEAEDNHPAASQISFGALARAQAALPSARDKKKNRKRQAGRDGDEDGADEDAEGRNNEHRPRSSAPAASSRPKLPKPHRSSKHAPTEQTSKRPVTRRREVVSYAKVEPRDPRFSAAVSAKGGGAAAADEERARRAYAFLDEYRDAEMGALREALRKTRDAGARDELKRALAAMQGRRQAQQRKDAERALVAEHRRRERDLVRQGKQPFYLKKSEQKKRLLVDRFAAMKKSEVDRSIERRRKKMAAKERRDMPFTRREAQ